MKTTGLMFKRWLDADWGHPEASWDEILVEVNGEPTDDPDPATIPDDATVTIMEGVVLRPDRDTGKSAKAHLRAWLKQQNTIAVLVEIPSEQRAAFAEYVAKFAKAKVVL